MKTFIAIILLACPQNNSTLPKCISQRSMVFVKTQVIEFKEFNYIDCKTSFRLSKDSPEQLDFCSKNPSIGCEIHLKNVGTVYSFYDCEFLK